MSQTWKRFLSLILSLSMVLSLMVIPAYAAPEEEQTDEPAAGADTTAVADSEEETVAPQTDESEVAPVAEADETNDSALPTTFTISSDMLGTMSVDTTGMMAAADAAVADEAVDNTALPADSDPIVATFADELNDVVVQDEEGNKVPLTDEQKENVLTMFKQYLKNWTDNANVLGVQLPFFLTYNDNKDELGILGEMLALAGTTVDKVRSGEYSYDDLTGTIMNFLYGDQLGVKYYGEKVLSQAEAAMKAVSDSGAQNEAQKLLALNDWLASVDSFDMAYIMNSGKDEDERAMVAQDEQKPEHYDDVHQALYDAYEPQIKANFESNIKSEVTQKFHDQIFSGIETQLRVKFYTQLKPELANLTGDDATSFNQDPDAYVKTAYPDEATDLVEQANAFIKNAEEKGVEQKLEDGTTVTLTVEQMTQAELSSEEKKIAVDASGNITVKDDGSGQYTYSEFIDLTVQQQMQSDDKTVELKGEDGTSTKVSIPDAIKIYSNQAADGLTDGVINYWEGTQFGALAQGKSVCLGYSKAYAYLIQYMHPEIYGTAATADMSVSTNWKAAKDLYYDANGNINIDQGYLVDLVRIHFTDDVTMFGETQDNFGSDHYWNAVKVDGKWYYVDTCYNDVYTEVMIRDRVEFDGYINHMYFLYSDTSARSLFDGYFSELKTLYENAATDQGYEGSWYARARSNVSYQVSGTTSNAYYVYDSTDTISQKSSSHSNFTSSSATRYSLAMHPLTATDKVASGDSKPGDSDFTSLIDFNYSTDDDDALGVARVRKLVDGEWKMVEDDFLTQLYALHAQQRKTYPSIAITCAYYDGKVYFNLSDCILSYDLSDGTVNVVKQYETTYGQRDTTKAFGGMAFKLVDEKADDRYVFENHPIAGILLRGDELTVSIATNLGYISGKDKVTNRKDENGEAANYTIDNKTNGYGYEFEETGYNSRYNSYINKMLDGQYGSFLENMGYSKQINDNDEFMWVANLVGTVSMSTLASGDAVEYKDTSCGDQHHYIKVDETYFTKDSSGNWNTGTSYVCTACGKTVHDPNEIYKEPTEDQLKEWDEVKASAGHTYAPTDATWSANDDGTYTASFTGLACDVCDGKQKRLDCLINDDTVTVTLSAAATLTTDPEKTTYEGTCTDGVTTNYVASGDVTDGTNTYKVTATDSVKGEAGAHKYEGTFNWVEVKDEDGNVTGYTCETADLKCSVCGDEQKGAKVNLTNEVKDPTCTEDGKTVYTATAVAEDGETVLATETKEVAGAKALGHAYQGVFTWAEDYSSATATVTCSRCDFKEENVEAKVTTTSSDATCTEGGKVTYNAAVYGEDGVTVLTAESKTVESDALGHDYKAENIKWSDDHDSATADLVCSRGDSTLENQTGSIVIETKDATCTEIGHKNYQASFIIDNKVVATTEYDEDLPALGHDYKAEFTWAEDYSSAKATLTCTRCNATLDKDAKVTVDSADATCTTGGKATYTATVYDEDGKTVLATESKTVEVAALGHEYEAKNVKWNADHTAVTADLVCSRGDSELKGVSGDITSKTTKATTCTEAGEIVYTATFTAENAKDVTVSDTVKTDALGHDYQAGAIQWSEDHKSASAEVTCSRCDYKETKQAAVEEKTTDATCTTGGTVTFTATVTVDGKVLATDQVTTEVAALGHTYGIADVKWSDDYTQATATLVCARNDSTIKCEGVVTSEVVKEPTCTETGSVRHMATFTVDGNQLEQQKNETTAALGHNYVDGVCTRCGDEEDIGVTIRNGVDYSAVYNFNYYVSHNSDIKRIYGNDPEGALSHFIAYGMKEGRQGCENFEVHAYFNRYADLRRAFGTDWKSYYMHFVNYGKDEGRKGTNCDEMQNYQTVYNGVDYSAVYDYNYYISHNADIKKAYQYDENAVLAHFVNYGMKEARQGCANFDVHAYFNRYADLRRAFGTDWKSYYMHFVNYGKKENRKGTDCAEMQKYQTVYNGVDYSAVYDYNYYISHNSDIKKAYQYDENAVLAHFVNYGMKEGRQASADFNVNYYRNRYSDLRKAFGDDLKSYYIHYIEYGQKEGRIGAE